MVGQVDFHGPDLHAPDLFLLARVKRHVRLKEHVVLLKIRLRNFQGSNHVVRPVVLFPDLFNRFRINRPAFFEQTLDRPFDARFALPGGQVEDLQVFTTRAGWIGSQKFIIGHAEPDARKQVVMPTVVLESARLANEAVDDVPVVDPMFLLAVQTRQTLGASLGVPDFKMLGEDTNRHLLADQPTRHAVGVLPDANRARTTDLRHDGIEEGKWLGGQGAERFAFLLEPLATTGVFLLEHVVEKSLILFSTGKVATPAKQQRLIHGGFQMAVEAFTIAVFVGASRVRLGRLDVVMQHQSAEPVGEITPGRKVLHRRTE